MVKIRDKIKYINIEDLVLYKRNNKKHPKEQIELLKKNIERFGFTTPLLIDGKSKEIIAGHGRYLAAKELEIKKLPFLDVSDLTEDEQRALRLADNKITELGECDLESINLELSDLDKDLVDLTGFEFDLGEKTIEYVEEDDYEVPPEDEIKTNIKYGDIIKLGNHRLMCGDSTKEEYVNKLLDGNKVNLVFTDPPYNIDYQDVKKKHKKIINDKMNDQSFKNFLEKVFSNFKTKVGYICCNWKYYHLFYKAMKNVGIPVKSCIVWDKEYGVQNLDKYYKQHEFILYFGPFGGEKTVGGDVYRLKRERSDLHPTMKPIELCSKFIQDNEGETVLDLFGGSGSTLIACEQLNRKCYMMELDPKYCEVICQRWEKLTGGKREYLVKN